MFLCKSLFRFELECGEMESRIVTKSLTRQLNQVLLHKQEENGIAINNNLSANQEDQQFVTPRKKFQSKQKHPWIEKRTIGHKTLHVVLNFFMK